MRQPTTAPRDDFTPFGLDDQAFDAAAEDKRGVRIVNLTLRQPRAPSQGEDRAAVWLRNAMIGLAALAVCAAVVSFAAQYRMVLSAKHLPAIAALEAGIPDVAALIFACLGIALALHGKRAIRARVLNVGAVATSITMNALAAGTGWRDFAIWVMPPVAYALASDTAIGVVRAYAIARQREADEHLADDEATPLAILVGLLLWSLRLVLAPRSTLRGFRRWVIDEAPVAPGRRELAATAAAGAPAQGRGYTPQLPVPAVVQRPARADTKTARFLALVVEHHGPLGAISLADTARIAGEVAPEVGLHPGSARTALSNAVKAARNGSDS